MDVRRPEDPLASLAALWNAEDRLVVSGLAGLGLMFVLLLHSRLLITAPIAYSDLTYTFVQGSFGSQLSVPYPSTAVATHAAYLWLGSRFGGVTNAIGVLSYALLPASMYPLVRVIGSSRGASALGSLLYLANPIVLFVSPIYVSWSLVLIAMPLVGALLVCYGRGAPPSYLIGASAVLATVTLLDPVLGGVDALRIAVPAAVGLAVAGVVGPRVRPRRVVLAHFGIAGLVFAAIALPAILVSESTYAYFVQQSQAAVSPFFSFHMANVVYTYQGQGILPSLSGVVSYPGNVQWNVGYEATAAYGLWVALVVSTYAVAILSTRRNRWHVALLATAGLASAAEFMIGTGALRGLFVAAPQLFLYEYPDYFSLIIAFGICAAVPLLIDRSLAAAHFFLNSGPEPRSHLLRVGAREVAITIRPRGGASPRSPSGRLGRIRGRRWGYGVAAVVLTALLFAPGLPAEIGYASGDSRLPPTVSNALPGYYFDLPARLLAPVSDYRVLPLPFNYTSYIDLRSVLPSANIFGIPYAGVNAAPGTYAPYGSLVTVLAAIAHNATSDLGTTLSQDNVRYVVVTNLASEAALTLTETGTEASLNGGGALLEGILALAPGLALRELSSRYAIFEVTSYTSPLTSLARLVGLAPAVASGLNQSVPTGLDPAFGSPPGAWGQWSSCPGAQSTWISYSRGAVTLSACPAPSSTQPAQTEIYQRVPLAPSVSLSITTSLNTTAPLTASLIVVFHNGSDPSSFYSSQQTFPPVALGPNRTSTFSIVAPADAEYAWLGFEILNFQPTGGAVSLSRLAFSVQHVVSPGPIGPSPTSVPFLSDRATTLNASAVPAQFGRYFDSARWIDPAASLQFSDDRNWSYAQPVDTLYLGNVSGSGSIVCDSGRTSALVAWVNASVGHGTLAWGNQTRSLAPREASWVVLESPCTSGTLEVSFTSTGLALADLLEVGESPTPFGSAATARLDQGSILLDLNGTAALETVESTSLVSVPQGSTSVQFDLNGTFVLVLEVAAPGTASVLLPHFLPTNSTAITLNLASFGMDAGMVSLLLVTRPTVVVRLRAGLGAIGRLGRRR